MTKKSKAFLLLLLVVLAFTTVPSLRATASPVIEPVAAALHGFLGPLALEVRDRVYAWDTRKELRTFANDLKVRWIAREPMPHPARFSSWLVDRTTSDGFDRWGNAYYLANVRDSIIVGSPGPDGEPDTDDDLHEGFTRSGN